MWRHLAIFVVWFQVMVPAPLCAQETATMRRLEATEWRTQPARAASSGVVVFRPAPAGLLDAATVLPGAGYPSCSSTGCGRRRSRGSE